MARTKKTVESATTPSTNKSASSTTSTKNKQPTAAEMREWYEKNKSSLERFAEAQDAIKYLKDVTKNKTKTISTFSKDSLRQYLQNIGSNEKNLRNLSRFLAFRSQAYYRLLHYHANGFELGARTVVPQYDLSKEQSPDKILKDYYATINMLDIMNLQQEFYRPLMNAFREDITYNMAYYDETGFFLLPLDPDYCKIAGLTAQGNIIYAIDATYFRSRQELLEYWGEPFQSIYKNYESTGQKWQLPPDEWLRSEMALKFRFEDLDIIIPVFVGLFNQLIGLADLENIAAIADEQEIYKLIFLEMENLSGTKNENDFKFSPELYINYFDRMINECLPDYVSAALVPGELKSISMSDTSKANDTNALVKASEALFNSAGGSILNGATISGTTAFTAMIKADTEFMISSLLPQIESWLNSYLKDKLGDGASKVKFMHISAYTKDKAREDLLASCQNGFSNKIAYNTLNDLSERDFIAMNFLENEALHITDNLIPLSTSYTQSSNEGGRPKNDNPTDESEADVDKRDSAGYE